jgi:hypothetical protein
MLCVALGWEAEGLPQLMLVCVDVWVRWQSQ